MTDGPWLPLAPAQRGLFFAHQLSPDNPCYTTAEVVEFAEVGAVEPEGLKAATLAAYEEFEQVRTRFRATSDGPRQQVMDAAGGAAGEGMQVVEVSDAAAAEAWMRAELARPMDLESGDVVRSALLRHREGAAWFHAAHHVVLDGYGAQQLLRRIAELYDDPGLAGEPTVCLSDLVAEDHSDPAAEAFWDARLASMTGTSSLAGRVGTPGPVALRRVLDLEEDLQRAITKGARRLGASWPDLFTTAVGTYVARMTATTSARVGLPLMNRTLPGVGALLASRTVCTAMNVLPATVPADLPVAGALTATAAEQAALREHPFERQEDLARRLDLRNGAQLFGVQVNVQPFELELSLGGAVGTVRNLTAGPVEDMTVGLRGTPGRGRRVRLEVDANPALHDESELDLHLARLRHWLQVWAEAAPETPVAELALLPDEERSLLDGFNDTYVERASATLGRRFVDQVARTPEAVALVMGDETRTYAELHDRATRIARGLAEAGVRAGQPVGVRLERSIGLYETIHALLLLGAVYLPLDPDLPEARIESMLADAGTDVVVADADVYDESLAVGGELVPPDEVDTPAYLLFTSGSTGRPKGVQVGHRAIDNRLAWMQHHLPLAEGDRVLHKTPISFDVSIWELYWPLQVGACVVIAEPGAHRDPRAIARLVVDEGISTLHFVPSMLRAFLADRTSRELVSHGKINAVVTSGEALTPDLVRGCAEAFGVTPTNLYGPTEAEVDVTCWDTDVAESTVPIGRPVWNTTCHVLDPVGRPLPVGAPGELWLGGVQLADGYVGRPDLTAERFVDTAYGRLYRTGDLATWRSDGALRYLGRTDDQVKLRGQRIELGEVEAALAGTHGVTGSAVGLVGDQLVAWYAAAHDADPEALVGALTASAGARLPAAFVPTHWVRVPEIPVGTSGKADRRRLATEHPPVLLVDGGAAPSDLVEQRLCALFADLLEVDHVPADADFFALGGDSLRVLRLMGAVEDAFGTSLQLADVFEHPTPTAPARVLADASGDGSSRGRRDLTEVLTLRRGHGDVVPLFVLPPAGGLGWCYTSLLDGLPPGLGVHTVQAPGLVDGAPEPVDSLTELAERQLAAVRTVVGDGAFHVAGWSLGGMAAHAVATLARRQGQEVGAVVALDAYPPHQWQDLAEPTEQDALVGILRLAGLDTPDGVMLDRDVVAELLRDSGSALAELPGPVLEGCLVSVLEAARLVRTDLPGPLPGDFTVVVASAPRPETHVDADGWRPLVEGTVRVVELPVTHGELVRRPVAGEVAAYLLEAIAATAGSR